MPLKYSKVIGRPTGLYLALLAAGTDTAPADVTVTVDAAGATAGANLIPITDPGTAIPKNTVLTFTRAAGSPATMIVVVTADFPSGGSGDLAVEMYEGEDGAGLDYALASGDAAAWDQLYTVVGTEDAPYNLNPQTQDLNPTVYGATSGISVSTPIVQSVAPSIDRSGLFLASGQLTQDIMQFGDTNRNWWAKQVIPDAAGAIYATREGLCRVTNVSEPKPAGDLIRLNYSIRFVNAKPALTFA